MQVLVLVADGSEEIETVTMIDVLRRAEISVTSASLNDLIIRGSRGIKIEADVLLSEITDEVCDTYDWLYLPGGMGGAMTFTQNATVQKLIMDFAAAGKKIAAICAAPLALDAAGILTNTSFTCYPGIEKDMAAKKYKGADIIVHDGHIWTAQGPAITMPFALALVSEMRGKKVAQQVATGLLWNKIEY